MKKEDIIHFVTQTIITQDRDSINMGRQDVFSFIQLKNKLQKFKSMAGEQEYLLLQTDLKQRFKMVIENTIESHWSLNSLLMLISTLDYLNLLDIPALRELKCKKHQEGWVTAFSILDNAQKQIAPHPELEKITDFRNGPGRILLVFLIQALYLGHFELVKWLVSGNSRLMKTGYVTGSEPTAITAGSFLFLQTPRHDSAPRYEFVSYPYSAAILGYGEQNEMMNLVIEYGGLEPFENENENPDEPPNGTNLAYVVNCLFVGFNTCKSPKYIRHCLFSLARTLKDEISPARRPDRIYFGHCEQISQYFNSKNIFNFLLFACLEKLNPYRSCYGKTLITSKIKLIDKIEIATEVVNNVEETPIIKREINQVTPEILFTAFKMTLENNDSRIEHMKLLQCIQEFVHQDYKELAKNLLKSAKKILEIQNQFSIVATSNDEDPACLTARFTHYIGIREYPLTLAQLKSTTFPNVNFDLIDEEDFLFTENSAHLDYLIDEYEQTISALLAKKHLGIIGSILDVVANQAVDFKVKSKLLSILVKSNYHTVTLESLVIENKELRAELSSLKQQSNPSSTPRFFPTYSASCFK